MSVDVVCNICQFLWYNLLQFAAFRDWNRNTVCQAVIKKICDVPIDFMRWWINLPHGVTCYNLAGELVYFV